MLIGLCVCLFLNSNDMVIPVHRSGTCMLGQRCHLGVLFILAYRVDQSPTVLAEGAGGGRRAV